MPVNIKDVQSGNVPDVALQGRDLVVVVPATGR